MEKNELKHNLDSLYVGVEAPWGSEPEPLVERAVTYLTGSTVLDLGSGDGRNSLFLAQKGFKVTAVDLSSEAIRQLNQRMSNFQANSVAVVADIANFDFPKDIDNIICTLVLHYLAPPEAKTVLHKIAKSVTQPNSIVVLESFTNQGQLMPPNNSGYWPNRSELIKFFEADGFETVYYNVQNHLTLQKDAAGKSCIHEVEEIIFRRSILSI